MKDYGRFPLGLHLSRFVGALFAPGVMLLAFAATVTAQIQPQGQTTSHSQPRKTFRAARLTYLEGDVTVEQANSTAKDLAIINMPLAEGSVISSGQDGQAEIEFEDGSLVRITPNSGISLLNLSVDASGSYKTRVALLGGLAYFELRAGTKYQYTVDAGGDVISPIENATIRVNLDEPPAVIAVLDGSAHIVTTSGSSDVDATAGQTVRIEAASEGGTYLVKQAISPESWDQWNEERDSIAASEAGSQTDARKQFAGDQGYGWSDLDANGSWYKVPGQGQVWQPDLADNSGDGAGDAGAGSDGFDPYGNGSWVWTSGGYSWASGYGWGWLPYRCGQWSYWDGFGWGWQPGIGCGLFGFGGYGYGGIGFNLGHVPGNWRRPHRPIPGPGPIHPIQRGRVGPMPVSPVHTFGGTGTGERPETGKTIAGQPVERLQPIGGGYTQRGGSALGWGLQRDYPIDSSTHEPVTGVIATHTAPAASGNARMPWQPAGSASPRSNMLPAVPGAVYRPVHPYQGGSGGSGSVNRTAPAQPRPFAPAPSPRSAPPPPPVQHSSPPAASNPRGK